MYVGSSPPKQLAAYDGSIDALCRQRGRKLHIEAEYCWCSECRKLLEESSMEHQLCSSPRMEPLCIVSFRFLKGPTPTSITSVTSVASVAVVTAVADYGI